MEYYLLLRKHEVYSGSHTCSIPPEEILSGVSYTQSRDGSLAILNLSTQIYVA
jgi:hypothetical protein